MVHGLFGTRDNWRAIRGLLEEHLDPSSAVLFVSHCNERARTFDGVDACGERLADEVRAVAARHPGLRRISLLSHSMGGLISRYAAGRLYDPRSGLLAGLQPCHYVAIATPHLGCDTQHRHPAQVPLIGWLAAVPGVGNAVHGIVSELAAPVSQLALGRAGRQFFLTDAEEEATALQPAGSHQQQVQHQAQQQAQQQEQQRGAGSRHGPGRPRGEPLLSRLTRDHPEEGLHFMSALAAFETRTLYANSSGDHLVGWANSSLRRVQELPPRGAAGAGVVLEDPLEAAWAPEARRRLAAAPAPYDLHSSEARRLSERAVLASGSPAQLAADGQGEHGAAAAFSSSSSGGQLAREEEMLRRLQALSWRRVDVCFGATLLPMLSHQHIQMQRWWVNWPGWAVAKHLALQIKAMEQLRASMQEAAAAAEAAVAVEPAKGGQPAVRP